MRVDSKWRPFSILTDLSLASRSSSPLTSLMALAQKILRRSTRMPMPPFGKTPPSSPPRSQLTGLPNRRSSGLRNSLWPNARSVSRPRSMLSRPTVVLRLTMRRRRRMTSRRVAGPLFSCIAMCTRSYSTFMTTKRLCLCHAAFFPRTSCDCIFVVDS